jgi:hypothetical protein
LLLEPVIVNLFGQFVILTLILQNFMNSQLAMLCREVWAGQCRGLSSPGEVPRGIPHPLSHHRSASRLCLGLSLFYLPFGLSFASDCRASCTFGAPFQKRTDSFTGCQVARQLLQMSYNLDAAGMWAGVLGTEGVPRPPLFVQCNFKFSFVYCFLLFFLLLL